MIGVNFETANKAAVWQTGTKYKSSKWTVRVSGIPLITKLEEISVCMIESGAAGGVLQDPQVSRWTRRTELNLLLLTSRDQEEWLRDEWRVTDAVHTPGRGITHSFPLPLEQLILNQRKVNSARLMNLDLINSQKSLILSRVWWWKIQGLGSGVTEILRRFINIPVIIYQEDIAFWGCSVISSCKDETTTGAKVTRRLKFYHQYLHKTKVTTLY